MKTKIKIGKKKRQKRRRNKTKRKKDETPDIRLAPLSPSSITRSRDSLLVHHLRIRRTQALRLSLNSQENFPGLTFSPLFLSFFFSSSPPDSVFEYRICKSKCLGRLQELHLENPPFVQDYSRITLGLSVSLASTVTKCFLSLTNLSYASLRLPFFSFAFCARRYSRKKVFLIFFSF